MSGEATSNKPEIASALAFTSQPLADSLRPPLYTSAVVDYLRCRLQSPTKVLGHFHLYMVL